MRKFPSLKALQCLLCENAFQEVLLYALLWEPSRVKKPPLDPMILEGIHGKSLQSPQLRDNSKRSYCCRRRRFIWDTKTTREEEKKKKKKKKNLLLLSLGKRKDCRGLHPDILNFSSENKNKERDQRDSSRRRTFGSFLSPNGVGGREHNINNIYYMAFGVFLSLLVLFPNFIIAYDLKPMKTSSQMTLAGERAKLPCKIPLPPEDRPILILWYKDQIIKPFYSYDARKTDSGRHKIHDNSDLATRSRFTLEKFPNKFKLRIGFLEIEEVSLRDAGNYTCRVDFWTSQTMMALVKLTVHEAIRSLEVFDGHGKMVSKVVGPYEQATTLTLSCRAYGGYPSPVVQWKSGGIVLESSTDLTYSGPESMDAGMIEEQRRHTASAHVNLHFAGLQRKDDGRQVRCVAFNTNLTQPRSRVLTIELYLPPLEVRLEGLEKPLMAGMESLIQCRATGSKPPATLQWKLQGASSLTSFPSQYSPNRNATTRRARFQPTADDNGRVLTCIASNPKVPHYRLAASKPLQVFFRPEVEARLAPALDPEKIKEGEDVYFECVIRSNPLESRVLWLHQGKNLRTDLAMGVLAQGRNLVLQKVSRHARGKYQCQVSNTIGTATSRPTYLNVMYAPECKGPKNSTVSVTPAEEVKLNCHVDSNPSDVHFVWKVNSTRGVTELDSSTYTSQGRTSTIVYRPSTHAIANDQYGVVFCQGINQLGIQRVPCMFVISPAGPPEEPRSCTLRNQSAHSLTVICEPGHDGGLDQHFVATIRNAESGEVVANVSSEEPIFSVGGLASGRDYLVMVKSVNNKGWSRPFVLEGFALKVAENKINDTTSVESSPLLAMFVGVVSGFVFILTVLVVANRARGRRRQGQTDAGKDSNTFSYGDEAPLSPSTNDASLHEVVGDGEPHEEQGEEEEEEKEANTTDSPTGSLLTKTATIQTAGSSDSLTTRTYVLGPSGHMGSLPRGHTGSLPRSYMTPKSQPLHSVDLPHVASNNHKYYTLKINCTRQSNESFV